MNDIVSLFVVFFVFKALGKTGSPDKVRGKANQKINDTR